MTRADIEKVSQMTEHDLALAESTLNCSKPQLSSSVAVLIMRCTHLLEKLADPFSVEYRFMREEELQVGIEQAYQHVIDNMQAFQDDLRKCREKNDARIRSYNLTPDCIAKKH
jgi:hypothetical protein